MLQNYGKNRIGYIFIIIINVNMLFIINWIPGCAFDFVKIYIVYIVFLISQYHIPIEPVLYH